MPKIKTHSGAKKRFRTNKTGVVRRSRAGRRHHAWARTTKQTTQLRKPCHVAKADSKAIKRLLVAE